MTPRLYIIIHRRIILSFPIQLLRALQERYEAMSNSAHSLKKNTITNHTQPVIPNIYLNVILL